MATSPSTALLMIGKGKLYFDRFDSGGLPTGLRDLGNSPNFTIQPTVESKEHFSSREGVNKKDMTVVLSAGLTVKFTLEEYDKNNLAMALFGDLAGSTINLLQTTQLEGELVFYGRPEYGPWFNVTLWKVSLKPTSEVSFIGNDWGKIEFEGEVLSDVTGHPSQEYGTVVEVVAS